MNFSKEFFRNFLYEIPLLFALFEVKNDLFILKSKEGSKKKGIDIRSCLFQRTL